MRRRLTRILVRFLIAIAVVLAFGGLFKLYSDAQFSAEKQNEVLIKAIPFVAVFVSIVLMLACVIVLAAVAFNGRVPARSYRPIEALIIAGILLGIVGLFQGWKLFAYEYGFLVLLFSVLAFMVWSHFEPMPARAGKALPPLGRRAHLVAGLIALIVWGVFAALLIPTSRPQEPYGFGKTLWDFKDDAEKAQIREEAEDEYRTAKAPLLALISLLPAGVVYFAVRELVPPAKKGDDRRTDAPLQRAGASPH